MGIFSCKGGIVSDSKRDSIEVDLKERRKPTAKERRYVQCLAAHQDRSRAMVEAGYSPKTDVDKVEKQIARTTLIDELDRVGLTDARLAEGLKDGLDAWRYVNAGQGNVIEEPDYHARFKFISKALDLRGHSTAKVVRHEGQVSFDMRGLLLGAFKLMGASSGIEVDEERLKKEIVEMSSAHEPYAHLETPKDDKPDPE